jgi:hypothetical protein
MSIDLKNLTYEDLIKLQDQIIAEIKTRNIVNYLICDINRYKSRDTVASYHKVFPAGIIFKDNKYYAITQVAFEWANEKADRLGWELIEL